MAPDRGDEQEYSRTGQGSFDNDDDFANHDDVSRAIFNEPVGQEPDPRFLARRSEQPQFTARALVLGLFIGVLIAFSNTYFGLQTGWISGMAMPSALIGFAYFKGLRTLMSSLGDNFARLGFGEGFSEVENVLVQTVAGSVGTMPLGCGFVGVVPALEFLLKPSETPSSDSNDPDIVASIALAEEEGGLKLPLAKLVLWALGICFFGVVFAVPLRKEVIVREKLKFPSGTATALMIGVLHGGEKQRGIKSEEQEDEEEGRALMDGTQRDSHDGSHNNAQDENVKRDWRRQIRLLTFSFAISGAYVSEAIEVATRLPPVVYTNKFLDTDLVLCSATAQHPISWIILSKHLVVVSEPFAGIRRTRNHHGPRNHHSHVTRRPSWMGSAVAFSQASGMGRRRRGRLEHWLERLDRLGQSGDHAGRRHRQFGVADSAPLDLLR